MKKTILTMAVIAFFAVTASSSYGLNLNKKSDKAQKDLTETKQDLKVIQKDSVADYQNFKKESEVRILKNEKSLADLKLEVSKADVKKKADCEKILADLNQKNVDLKKRLVDYDPKGDIKLASFKTEFNNDLDALEKELENFTVENKE